MAGFLQATTCSATAELPSAFCIAFVGSKVCGQPLVLTSKPMCLVSAFLYLVRLPRCSANRWDRVLPVSPMYSAPHPQFLPAELGHIKRTLLYNGYPSDLANSCITRRLRHLDGDITAREPTREIRIPMPYYQSISEKIEATSQDLGFTVCFSRSANIGSMLRSDKVKVALDQQPGAVYGIACTCMPA
ncbi:hypothetical protein M514_00835 [Trichuris suis]|uniref:Uncharacterized protein n=1 Tax=Trichuris suis TaxID=68888 RepID=A0A085N073_9BILA|nr:hypothetical protein M513_00835 [Trichuris suis]KFD62869.1 hypothetical protein M514_00835 [Trichuris suis]